MQKYKLLYYAQCINLALYDEPLFYQTNMNLEEMKKLGDIMLDLIERNHPDYDSIMSQILLDSINNISSNYITKDQVSDWIKSLIDED